MKEYTQHKFGKFLPAMQEEEFNELCKDIKTKGLLFPIYLFNNEILDGWHRYKACIKMNVEPRFEQYKGESPIQFVISTATRRNLTASQRACLALEVLPELEQEAKQRQIASGGDRKSVGKLISQPISATIDSYITDKYVQLQDSGSNGRAAVEASVMFDVNPTYIKDVKKIRNLHPEKYEMIKSGKANINEVKKELKKEKRADDIDKIKKKIETENLTINDKFDTVVIDPPWPYDRDFDPDVSRVANPYPEMPIKEIQAIDIPLKDNGVLFLWTTHQFLPYAFQLLDGWNLKYKATMVWDKEKMGMGANIRMQCEFCLIAFKGKPLINGSGERDIIREARRQHSRKPDSFYSFVERYTVGTRLEYFSREDRKGWQTFGAETSKFKGNV